MSKIDIRLLYSRDTGGISLGSFDAKFNADYNNYILWLEEELEKALSVEENVLKELARVRTWLELYKESRFK